MSNSPDADAAAIAKFKRDSVYNSAASQKLRAEASRQPNELDRLRVRHAEEKTALGNKKRADGLALASRQANRRSRDLTVQNGGMPPDLLQGRDRKERASLEAEHRSLDAQLAAKQNAEMAAAIARHPLP